MFMTINQEEQILLVFITLEVLRSAWPRFESALSMEIRVISEK